MPHLTLEYTADLSHQAPDRSLFLKLHRALEILRAHFTPPPEGAALQITVEVQEIVAATYFKDPPGTLTPPAPKSA